MKLLFALMLSCVALPVFADDVPAAVDRVGCSDISARISELEAMEEPTEDDLIELEDLKADYRIRCVKSARGRRTSAEVTSVAETVRVIEEEVDDELEEVVKETDVSVNVVTEGSEEEIPEVDTVISLEQELANLDAGLCADGSAPNKFGCCGDEVFKDLGNTVFACCPKGGTGDCFPPLK